MTTITELQEQVIQRLQTMGLPGEVVIETGTNEEKVLMWKSHVPGTPTPHMFVSSLGSTLDEVNTKLPARVLDYTRHMLTVDGVSARRALRPDDTHERLVHEVHTLVYQT